MRMTNANAVCAIRAHEIFVNYGSTLIGTKRSVAGATCPGTSVTRKLSWTPLFRLLLRDLDLRDPRGRHGVHGSGVDERIVLIAVVLIELI